MGAIQVDGFTPIPSKVTELMEALRSENVAFAKGQMNVEGRTFFRKHCGERMYKVVVVDEAVTIMLKYRVCGICGGNVLSSSSEAFI